MKSIYQAMKEANVPMDSHESDLYVKVTEESRKIMAEYPDQSKTIFKSNKDGSLWVDLAFAYEPWWEARKTK